jgi:dienelactone hydrolase
VAEIVVNPPDAPSDTKLDVLVVDLPPDEKVTVRACTADQAGRFLTSQAVFQADERGVVDLTRHAPVEGSYSGVDPMGLFWSLTPTGDAAEPDSGTTTIQVDGVGEVDVERRTVPEGVRRTEVRERGLVGTLFRPEDEGTYPGVILLGGSEGGLREPDAAMLAAHGFTVLALAYFGVPGVPEHLVEVPLEYFGTAIEYLRERAGEIGVVGGSRGGEAALLIGATYPDVRAVVSVVGSGVATQAIGPGANLVQILEHEASAWTRGGEPLPYLPYSVPDELRRQVVNGEPVPLRSAYDLSDGIPDEAVIPVERIAGGVLLISAGRDGMWPSAELSEVAEQRLAEHDHPFPHRHVRYPDAGHLITGPPYRPTTEMVVPGPGVSFFTGGTPDANAAAQADAWHRITGFLSEQLGT